MVIVVKRNGRSKEESGTTCNIQKVFHWRDAGWWGVHTAMTGYKSTSVSEGRLCRIIIRNQGNRTSKTDEWWKEFPRHRIMSKIGLSFWMPEIQISANATDSWRHDRNPQFSLCSRFKMDTLYDGGFDEVGSDGFGSTACSFVSRRRFRNGCCRTGPCFGTWRRESDFRKSLTFC